MKERYIWRKNPLLRATKRAQDLGCLSLCPLTCSYIVLIILDVAPLLKSVIAHTAETASLA